MSAGGDAKVEPIAISGLTAPTRGIAVKSADDCGAAAAVRRRSRPRTSPFAPPGPRVHMTWDAPKGTGVNEEAPFKVRWKKAEGLSETPADTKTTGATVKKTFDLVVKPAAAPRARGSRASSIMVVCDVETHAVCVPVRRALELGFAVTKDGAAETVLKVKLPEAKAPK